MKNRIKEVAKIQGIKTSCMAKTIGISRYFMYDLINEKCTPSVDTAKKIAKILNTPVEELFLDEKTDSITAKTNMQ